jgi:hypothetical protein
MTPQGLHENIKLLLKLKGELIYGNVHVLNISEEEYIDQFSEIHYRVYSNQGHVFDIIQSYSSEADDGGGGLVYEFLPCVWDGFEEIRPISLEDAYTIIKPLFHKEKIHHFEFSKMQMPTKINNMEDTQ